MEFEIPKESKILLIDEWIETGAQIQAAIKLIESQGGIIAAIASINIDDNQIINSIKKSNSCYSLCD